MEATSGRRLVPTLLVAGLAVLLSLSGTGYAASTLSDSMSLTYIAGYSKFDGSSTFDQDGGVASPTSFSTGATYQANNTVASKYKNYSHELELQSTGTHAIDWQTGLYYAAENNSIRFDIPVFNGTQQGSVSWQGSFIQLSPR